MSAITWRNAGESPFSGLANLMNSFNSGFQRSSQTSQEALRNPLVRANAAKDRLRQTAIDEATIRAKDQAFDTGALNQQKLQFGLKNQQGDLDALRAKEAQALINAKQSGANASQLFNQRANKQQRADKLREDQAAWTNQRLALGNEHLGSEDINNQFLDMYQNRGMSPDMINFKTTLRNSLEAPSNAEAAITKQAEVLRKEALKTEQDRLDNETKIDVSLNKKKDKKGSYSSDYNKTVASGLVTDKTQSSLAGTSKLMNKMDAQGGYNYKGTVYNIPKAAMNNINTAIAQQSNASWVPGDTNIDSDLVKEKIEEYIRLTENIK